METEKLLFCDGSVDPPSKIGFGAYLLLNQNELNLYGSSVYQKKIQTVKFISTSSSKLELQILLFALENINLENGKLTIFTDSQTIANLLNRREKLESNRYISRSKNKEIEHADLYQKFFLFYDELGFNVIKLKGHQKKSEKDIYHEIFTLIDRSSRKALREYQRT